MEHVRQDLLEQCAAANRHMRLRLTKNDVEPPLPYDLEITIDTIDLTRSPGARYLVDCQGLLRIVNIDDKTAWLSPPHARTLGRVIRMEWQFA